jgi:ComF family protein
MHPGHVGNCLWLGAYEEPLDRLVRALKYEAATRLAPWLGRALAEQAARLGWRPDVACPVPLHPARRRHRGYNQAALLARELATALDVPCLQLLARRRPTLPQARLSRAARAANVAGAFLAEPARTAGRCVLLVDDVLTTGATAAACAAALRRAGARRVRVAVVARADRPPTPGRSGAAADG